MTDTAWDGVERRDIVSRRRRKVNRFLDRRGGFDRRRRYPILGPVFESPLLLFAVLVLLNVLSLVDGFYTAVEVGLGVAREANPLLAAAAAQSPFAAVAFKVGVVGSASALIWFNRKRRAVLATGVAGLVLYAALVAYHRYALITLGLL
jgi:hypothetical protein